MGSPWGHLGATLKLLGGTWGALGDHWELDGTFLGGFWCLEGLLGGPWGELGRVLEAYKQETLIFASETKGRATKTQTRRGRDDGASGVQGGCEDGSKGKWKSASAPRDHQEEDLKEDIIRSNTLWAIGPANFMKHWGRIGVTWGHFGVTLRSLGGTWEALGVTLGSL